MPDRYANAEMLEQCGAYEPAARQYIQNYVWTGHLRSLHRGAINWRLAGNQYNAHRYFNELRHALSDAKELAWCAIAMRDWAMVALDQGRHEVALMRLRDALHGHSRHEKDELSRRVEVGMTHSFFGRVYLSKGDMPLSYFSFMRAHRTFELAGNELYELFNLQWMLQHPWLSEELRVAFRTRALELVTATGREDLRENFTQLTENH